MTLTPSTLERVQLLNDWNPDWKVDKSECDISVIEKKTNKKKNNENQAFSMLILYKSKLLYLSNDTKFNLLYWLWNMILELSPQVDHVMGANTVHWNAVLHAPFSEF